MIHVVILAGGKGTRMQSDLPKVLHPVKGIPIITRLLQSVTTVCKKPTIIVGHKAYEVMEATNHEYNYAEQKEQRGTGHALMIAREALADKDISTLVVLPGDHPLVSSRTIRNLVDNHEKSGASVSLCTVIVEKNNPLLHIFNNFGRIVRNSKGDIVRIVEFKDATPDEKEINEFNLSYYCFDAKWLWKNLNLLTTNNASHEYYLTDMIEIANRQGRHIDSYRITDITECMGINTPEQLKMVEDMI